MKLSDLTFEQRKDKNGKIRLKTNMVCPICKKTRWVSKDNIKTLLEKDTYTGKCKHCRPKGKDANGYKGGKYIASTGYIAILITDDDPFVCMRTARGTTYEHRHIMAKHLDRPLTRFEHVHHRDGNKTNNSIDNLELVNGQTHCLITQMETEINRLKKENAKLREDLYKWIRS